MPLPDEFAQTTQAAIGAQASIVLPAPAANVAYLITHVAAQMEDTSSTGSAFDAELQVLDGATQVLAWRLALGAGIGTASADLDLVLLITRGNAATVRFAAGVGGVIQNLLVRGTAI